MNPAHIHLLTNHIPILGVLFGLLVLLYGFTLRNASQPVRNAAYLLFLVAAIGAMVANWSGEGAEELAEHLPGIAHKDIEEHEAAAGFALWTSLITGTLALAGLVFSAVRPAWNGRLAVIVCVAALFTSTVVARTGYLGGKIRHTEIDNPPPTEQDGR